ncbi:hypothetical protein GNP79_06975 [Aliivibrio fischeri]|uniref:Uncharacterized protein n=1 Tax=Aliivibrio fischeri TaxID=668 RepID=A0A6N3YYX5_ALIFS|nr:hypothetical protein [Aliivibrio fischeri]MUK44887.1 hypothetical protein [Aliivibrio fischeri]MUK80546.1 hypothetical protein [Aliivibrio fischeri]MUK84445.1 hypothetical protein [Aliivibrio fischeri]
MIQLISTRKLDIECEEQYAVVINNKVFFRVFGENGDFTISTATAGDYDLGFDSYEDKKELVNVIYS